MNVEECVASDLQEWTIAYLGRLRDNLTYVKKLLVNEV